MRYRLIKGTFRLFYTTASGSLRSSAPEGDSVWFKPNEPARFDVLSRRGVRYNKGSCVQLRFEGADTLELHYQGLHQNLPHATEARGFVIRKLGIGDVSYGGDSGMLARTASKHPVEGYILSNGVDPHGRPISFVFAGKATGRDGSTVELDARLLAKSINAQLAEEAHAYPMFYTSLPEAVRGWMATRFEAARRGRRGIWRVDRTTAGFPLAGLEALQELAVWPKLFRRLASWYQAGGEGSFVTWLAGQRDSDDVILVDGEERRMSSLVRVRNRVIEMELGIWGGVVVPRRGQSHDPRRSRRRRCGLSMETGIRHKRGQQWRFQSRTRGSRASYLPIKGTRSSMTLTMQCGD